MSEFLRLVITIMFQAGALGNGTHAVASKYIDSDVAIEHATAAMMAERKGVSAELLLGLAYVESKFNPMTVSRVSHGKRKTGTPTWTTPPRHVKGPYFCGVTQAIAKRSWKRCVELQDIFVAYDQTASEIAWWLRQCKGKMNCALLGYGGGYASIERGTSPYPGRVLKWAKRIKKATCRTPNDRCNRPGQTSKKNQS